MDENLFLQALHDSICENPKHLALKRIQLRHNTGICTYYVILMCKPHSLH